MPTSDLGEMRYDSTPAQRQVTLAVALAGVALATVCAGLAGAEWSAWQWCLVLFVAFDIVGGVAAMCLPPAIEKIRPADHPLRPILFAAFHVHPLILALALPDASWLPLVCLYLSGVVGVVILAITPPPFRPSAALAWCAVVIATISIMGMPPALEWLAPAFILKLVGSHAVPAPPVASPG